jgi:hypothetical protein
MGLDFWEEDRLSCEMEIGAAGKQVRDGHLPTVWLAHLSHVHCPTFAPPLLLGCSFRSHGVRDRITLTSSSCMNIYM